MPAKFCFVVECFNCFPGIWIIAILTEGCEFYEFVVCKDKRFGKF